ncbi:MAG: 4Fe-4S ferredoxin [Spirochaetae bacterium HGW-Spirochaetae-7]|jgi:Fe-S-cluster-containing hydrogenase component 2|nr:MAG: 4Fe-4S ferredoxin [Spirochaetae bacterium HGW-Spirochaetae-7]
MNDDKTLKVKGAPSLAELRAAGMLPSVEDLSKGACLCIECVEEIPCNPCETSCPQGAIAVGTPITNLPVLDGSKCTACGLCIAACPGLAIMMKDGSGDEAVIRFPYEYFPLPEVGQKVTMCDRMGKAVCVGTIKRVDTPKRNDRTAVVTAAFDKSMIAEVVSMVRLNRT